MSAFDKFKQNIRLKYFFADDKEAEHLLDPYNPSLYIISKWQPPAACSNIKNRISDFQTLLSSTRKDIIKNTRPFTNLSTSQLHLLDWLKDNPDFIVLDTDTNCEPAIMERSKYIKAIFDQHLLNSNNYTELAKLEAKNMRDKFTYKFNELLQFEHVNDLSDQERIIFQQEFQSMTRTL